MATAELRQQIDAAIAYESLFVSALFGVWAPNVAGAAGIEPGHAVLDVACGTGVLARSVAALTGRNGTVTRAGSESRNAGGGERAGLGGEVATRFRRVASVPRCMLRWGREPIRVDVRQRSRAGDSGDDPGSRSARPADRCGLGLTRASTGVCGRGGAVIVATLEQAEQAMREFLQPDGVVAFEMSASHSDG